MNFRDAPKDGSVPIPVPRFGLVFLQRLQSGLQEPPFAFPPAAAPQSQLPVARFPSSKETCWHRHHGIAYHHHLDEKKHRRLTSPQLPKSWAPTHHAAAIPHNMSRAAKAEQSGNLSLVTNTQGPRGWAA
ncbi:hypothetical protein CCUS01_05920 [Colletotrichum cuscutae]|uniref:Uncharacterized protein n=1 Tax=Colletotrichum cuscutae TaxID=1209917 RepID=A0AAI9Y4Z8_9PEZI|nr:hypothetical protein CCUS01_05920 [Colletotrichum cuscutae]